MRSVALAVALMILAPCGASLAAPTYSFVTLDVPGSVGTFARGINNAGQVVGDFALPAYQSGVLYYVGFLFDPATGSYTRVDTAPAGYGNPNVNGINNRGQVVGDAEGFSSGGSIYQQLFVFDAATHSLTFQPYSNYSANGINDNGQIVGSYDYTWPLNSAFLFDLPTGAYTRVSNPVQPTGNIYFEGINNFGKIVGY